MLTAKEANKKTTEKITAEETSEWNELERLISEAIENKQFYIEVLSLSNTNKTRLENLGYMVCEEEVEYQRFGWQIMWNEE